jgi:hypothetical protein
MTEFYKNRKYHQVWVWRHDNGWRQIETEHGWYFLYRIKEFDLDYATEYKAYNYLGFYGS